MAAPRKEFLLGGRRVLLSDVINAGTLQVGDVLYYQRPHAEELYRAVVTERGHLQLDNGASFQSPSRAAAVAARQTSVAGWQAWRLERDGRSLDDLRQQLLSDEERVASAGEDEPAAAARLSFLARARAAALAGDPLEVTVRELLGHWNASSRGSGVARRVANDLANHGLVVDPDFRAVALAAPIRIVAEDAGTPTPSEPAPTTPGVTAEAPITVTVDAGVSSLGDSDDAGEVDYDVAITLGNMQAGESRLVSAEPGWSLDEAITTMELHDFSQLPVMATRHRADFAVTWKSIAQAKNRNPDATFRDAWRRVETFDYRTKLVDVIDRLLKGEEFVLVKGASGEIDGIVTTADVVLSYGNLAIPFFLIGELDQALRRLLTARVSLDRVKALCDPDGQRVLDHNSLSFGDYLRVLENVECWESLGWTLNRRAFIKGLKQLKDVRNDLMHFNSPDPVPVDFEVKCRQMIAMVVGYAAAQSDSASGGLA